MADKPKLAFYWCASCGGCEESLVDLAEDILGVVEAVDIVFWPVAMDFKRSDVEKMPDGSITVSMINGAVRNSEQLEMVHLLRAKSQVVIAYGSCSSTGGIPSLANQFDREQILKFIFDESPSTVNEGNTRPMCEYQDRNGNTLELPAMHHVVRSLEQVIDVDYHVPGCAPTPKLVKQAIDALLSGNLPPKGSVLAPDIALCDECARKDTKPENMTITEFKRPHLTEMDPELCFLAQGIICMGPATRGGCESLCTTGNMPCTGCFGPTSRVKDQGAKMLSCLAANIAAKDDDEIKRILSGIPDPTGTFYRYGLSSSLIRKRI